MELNFINVIILFGALQGFTVCLFLNSKKRSMQSVAGPQFSFFILFLFCLAFHNLIYALIYMNIHKVWPAANLFPFSYKYLIAVGLYFYVKHHFAGKEKAKYHVKERWLFLPAIVYFGLKTYWFSIAIGENSTRIMQKMMGNQFFNINEFVVLAFNIVLAVLALRFLKQNVAFVGSQPKQVRSFQWMRRLLIVYLVITVLNLLFFAINLMVTSGVGVRTLYYPTLFINAGFIYWLGFIGFTRSEMLFATFVIKDQDELDEKSLEIQSKLEEVMVLHERYKNPNLTLADLATELNLSDREISTYVNDVLGMNFSEYVTQLRVKKVQELLSTDDAQKFTLMALAEEAGFSSKSSFNAAFKRITGQTPSAYRKGLKQ